MNKCQRPNQEERNIEQCLHHHEIKQPIAQNGWVDNEQGTPDGGISDAQRKKQQRQLAVGDVAEEGRRRGARALAQLTEDQQTHRGEHHQYQQEPEVRDQLPDQSIVFLIEGEIRPVFRLAFHILQHDELRQRQQRDGRQHRYTHALHAHFPPPLQGIAQEEHIREIAGNDKKHLHAEGMNKIVKQR